MKVGYARISTDDQKLDLQSDALQGEGCSKVYKDIASGGKAERKGLFDAIKFMRKGDTLVVWKLDRLGRSLKDLIKVVNKLNKGGIFFKSMQENIDTASSGGKLTFHLFGALAEFERDIIRERTQAGLQAARARGRIGGRPKVMNEKMAMLAKELMANPNNSAKEVANTLGVSRATLYRYI
ncbi:recombinase family protein [candidate division KSB1 bacterium]|nr:recombinase family protein [candidate division KSB1 bacterium]